MEHARKMVLLPEDSISKLQIPFTNQDYQQNYQQLNGQRVLSTTQTPGTHLKRIDDDMSHVLNSSVLSDKEKWTQYQQLLQRYLGFQHQTSVKSTDDIASDKSKTRGVNNQTIISTVPPTLKRKCELLLQFLESQQIKDRISWDRRGEVTIDNVQVPSSNIIDLVNDIVRNRKNAQSVGREYFSWFLRDNAVPLEYIGNLELYKAGAKFNGSKRAPVLPSQTLNNDNNHLNHNNNNNLNESSFHRSLTKRMSSTPNKQFQKKKSLSFDDELLDTTVVANPGKNKKSTPLKKTKNSSMNKSQTGNGWMTFSF